MNDHIAGAMTAVFAGIPILLFPRLLNDIVALCLIVFGITALVER